ncbi:hypothetical protein C8Q79DRAFT_1005513 [Trametes meyenii]|nr:hypothetical protein C8Q79DRAFT_1005513 [Trametes meyenii]
MHQVQNCTLLLPPAPDRCQPECRILSAGLATQAGFPLKVKAVLFPVEGGEPRIVELPYRLEHRGESPNIPGHRVDLRPVLGNATPWPTTIQLDGFKGGRPLGRSLTLVYNDHFLQEKKPPNLCIDAITHGRGFKWADNLVGFRNRSPADRIAQYEDVTDDDVGVFKKYFEEGGDGNDTLDPATEFVLQDLIQKRLAVQLVTGVWLIIARIRVVRLFEFVVQPVCFVDAVVHLETTTPFSQSHKDGFVGRRTCAGTMCGYRPLR